MKTLILTIGIILSIGLQGFASVDTTSVKPKNIKKEKAILSPEQEKLFQTGRLSEVVVSPVYTTVEQLLFTEMIKKVKNKN